MVALPEASNSANIRYNENLEWKNEGMVMDDSELDVQYLPYSIKSMTKHNSQTPQLFKTNPQTAPTQSTLLTNHETNRYYSNPIINRKLPEFFGKPQEDYEAWVSAKPEIFWPISTNDGNFVINIYFINRLPS